MKNGLKTVQCTVGKGRARVSTTVLLAEYSLHQSIVGRSAPPSYSRDILLCWDHTIEENILGLRHTPEATVHKRNAGESKSDMPRLVHTEYSGVLRSTRLASTEDCDPCVFDFP